MIKIGIVGGGNIGGVLVAEIVNRRLARNVGLVDIKPPDLAKGKCLDIAEGTAVIGSDVVLEGSKGYEVIDADFVTLDTGTGIVHIAPAFGEDDYRIAREKGIPYFGLCLGMQVAVIEAARNLAGLGGAMSTEFDKTTPHPVIALITEWQTGSGDVEQRDEESDMGGTMRLGAQEVTLKEDSLAATSYGKTTIEERHRHRYEVNQELLPQLEAGDARCAICPPFTYIGQVSELLKGLGGMSPDEPVIRPLAGDWADATRTASGSGSGPSSRMRSRRCAGSAPCSFGALPIRSLRLRHRRQRQQRC